MTAPLDFAAIPALAALLVPLRTYTASTISFSGATILDSANGVSIFPAWTRVKVTDSAHNDGTYDVLTSAAGTLTLASGTTLTTEAAGASVTLTWKFETVYSDSRDAVNPTDFPSLWIFLTPGEKHSWRNFAFGTGRNVYTISLWIFLGVRGQASPPLSELFSRVKPYVRAIADILFANQHLGHSPNTNPEILIGGAVNGGAELFTYSHGAQEFGDGQYWILEIELPIAENYTQTMTA